jgi:vacuolar protein sorting-associated protein 13A/C
MLEGIAAKILSSYLGKYIEGLDKENLSVGITSGNVSLRNLRIRLDALKEINMPVVVRAGADCVCVCVCV